MKLGPNDLCWCASGKKYKKCHQGRDLLQKLQGLEPEPVTAADFKPVRPNTVMPRLTVPEHIIAPDYATSGKPMGSRSRNLIKNADQLARMRLACAAARRVLDRLCSEVAAGMTTDEIDRRCHALCIAEGGYPSTLNYHGFPKSLCTSVNEVICHGIPDLRPLQDGDIVNIDVTIFIHGMHGDCSNTVGVGALAPASQTLVAFTHECMMLGIQQVRPGGLIRDIGKAIEGHATAHGYGVVRAFVGHGLGELFHMDPQVPHYYDPASTFEMLPGHTFTIEPMINHGTWKHQSWNDGWTAVTADLKRSAQFEHTVLVTERGVEILTLPDGQAQPFAH